MNHSPIQSVPGLQGTDIQKKFPKDTKKFCALWE
jgi:hypothetical protein